MAIQFPDPHFKKRHHKRRVVQPALVRAVAEGLRPGARVFLQSDVREVSEDMREKFERFGAHLFHLDAELHDVSGVDAAKLAENAAASVEAAAVAFEEDERARVSREAAERDGWPGRRRDVKPEAKTDAAEDAPAAPAKSTDEPIEDDEGDEAMSVLLKRNDIGKRSLGGECTRTMEVEKGITSDSREAIRVRGRLSVTHGDDRRAPKWR